MLPFIHQHQSAIAELAYNGLKYSVQPRVEPISPRKAAMPIFWWSSLRLPIVLR